MPPCGLIHSTFNHKNIPKTRLKGILLLPMKLVLSWYLLHFHVVFMYSLLLRSFFLKKKKSKLEKPCDLCIIFSKSPWQSWLWMIDNSASPEYGQYNPVPSTVNTIQSRVWAIQSSPKYGQYNPVPSMVNTILCEYTAVLRQVRTISCFRHSKVMRTKFPLHNSP